MDLSNYELSFYLGHKAFEGLYKAYRIYSEPVAIALLENNINVTNIDFKDKSDIQIESRSKRIKDINEHSVDPINAFHFAGDLSDLRRREAEHCIDASIYFQAAMEAEINDVLGMREGSFKNKWEGFLSKNNAPDEVKSYFSKYHDVIYKKIRIPSVHAKNKNGLKNIETVRFAVVHEGLRCGWYCFVFLLNVIHQSNMDYSDSWRFMCEECHSIPSIIDPNEYPDYIETSNRLRMAHLNHFNSLIKESGESS